MNTIESHPKYRSHGKPTETFLRHRQRVKKHGAQTKIGTANNSEGVEIIIDLLAGIDLVPSIGQQCRVERTDNEYRPKIYRPYNKLRIVENNSRNAPNNIKSYKYFNKFLLHVYRIPSNYGQQYVWLFLPIFRTRKESLS